MKKIKVSLSENSYDIFVGKSIYDQLTTLLKKHGTHKNTLVVADGNVMKLHGKKIRALVSSSRGKSNLYILKPGEKSKSYTELNKIYSFLLEKGYGRDTLIIAAGGGVTGDLVGYAASTFMRGVQLVHIPTTLLAAVDSSVGGKTGINFDKKKNMIGTFYQPEFVFIDTDFLATLPDPEIKSGLGEVIKYAFLSDESFFSYVSKNLEGISGRDAVVLEKTIIKSAGIKAAVVSQDERESGLRKILNLGHTFAHAYESELNFKVKHGEAVIAGIVSALILSGKMGLLPASDLEEYLKLPLKVKISPLFRSFDSAGIYRQMSSDKKNRGGKIKFVLTSGIGKILLDVEAPRKTVMNSLEASKKLIRIK